MQRFIDRIQRITSVVFGPQWFRVEFRYRDKSGNILFIIEQAVAVNITRAIGLHREIKQATGALHKEKRVTKRLLCNGTLDASPTCYLGRWHIQRRENRK